MPHPSGRRFVLILLLLATSAAFAVAIWAVLEARHWDPSGGSLSSAILLLGAGLILALGLVPVGGVAGAARAGPGLSRVLGAVLGAGAGLGLAGLSAVGAILVLETTSRSAARWLVPVPLLLSALAGAAALRLAPGRAGWLGALAALSVIAAGALVLRIVGF